MSASFLIVVPVLNSIEHLSQLLDSLTSQSYRNWRVLFVDGGSKPYQQLWLENYCSQSPRFSLVYQDTCEGGIYDAMNLGFREAAPYEWLFFWGSDDWAPGCDTLLNLSELINSFSSLTTTPDLVVCQGQYVNSTGSLGRLASFVGPGVYRSRDFRRCLFNGFTPPHQATLFSPNIVKTLGEYSLAYRLAADLDYFLQLSLVPGLLVYVSPLNVVRMSVGGISGRLTKLRLKEVMRAYYLSFGPFLFVWPFVSRYINRIYASFFSRP